LRIKTRQSSTNGSVKANNINTQAKKPLALEAVGKKDNLLFIYLTIFQTEAAIAQKCSETTHYQRKATLNVEK